MEAETRSKPVSIALLLKLASSQTENEREKQNDGLWPWAADRERKKGHQLQRHSSGHLVRVGRKAGSEPREGHSWAEGIKKWGLGETIYIYIKPHIQSTHAVQPPAPPALTAGDKGQQNHPRKNAKGSRRAKVAGFAFPMPEGTCVTYILLPPTPLSAIKLICHDVSRSLLTF